jgi:Ni,Fe-hydrogenase III component G
MRFAKALLWLDLPLAERAAASYPDLVPFFPCAGRMQRAAADLLGVVAEGATDRRPWLNHGAWPEAYIRYAGKLRRKAAATPREVTDYRLRSRRRRWRA